MCFSYHQTKINKVLTQELIVKLVFCRIYKMNMTKTMDKDNYFSFQKKQMKQKKRNKNNYNYNKSNKRDWYLQD